MAEMIRSAGDGREAITPIESANASPSASRRNRAERQDLGLAWTVSALGGAGLILGFNVLSYLQGTSNGQGAPPKVPVWVASASPLVFMAGYLWFAMGRSRRSVQRIADSVYFMGFWWTLWALLVTLSLNGLSLQPTTVFQAFGYALFTTAAGMFLRMSLLQFNRTLDDQEIEAIDTIDERIALFRSALDDVTRTIGGLNERLGTDLTSIDTSVEKATQGIARTAQAFVEATRKDLASVDAHIATVTVSMSDAVERFVSTLTKSLNDQGQRLFEAVQVEVKAILLALAELKKATARVHTTVSKQGADLDVSIGALAKSLMLASEQSGQAFDRLVQKLDTIEVPPNIIQKKLEGLSAGVETSLAATREQLETTTESLAGLEAAAASIPATLAKIPETLRAIDASLDAIARKIATLTETSLGRINGDLEGLGSEIRDARQSLGKLAQGVTEMVAFVDRRLR